MKQLKASNAELAENKDLNSELAAYKKDLKQGWTLKLKVKDLNTGSVAEKEKMEAKYRFGKMSTADKESQRILNWRYVKNLEQERKEFTHIFIDDDKTKATESNLSDITHRRLMQMNKFGQNIDTLSHLKLIFLKSIKMPLFRESNLEYDCYSCKPRNSKCFENDFDKWISGNETIDKFNAQLNTDIRGKVIEFIPYDRFLDFEQIARGGYSTIYYAKRLMDLLLNSGILKINNEKDMVNPKWY
ncbi:hypothetical protein Glove_421g85 [Diversispora epigaea]|uniref:Protein kinase domain-containing protein n=1 Tax=Diversispora epigaea TaxID=1348612 RepID=A0A397GWF0_9GLOM|nr:hypothetical protein Glove_421g85 [Diversispora epigaea]